MLIKNKYLSFLVFGIMAFTIILALSAHAQYWTTLPPYNVLWPLRAPVLSPPVTVTGLSNPLLNSLTMNTELPIQPCLAWNPSQGLPWLIYNNPSEFGGGLLFYDLLYGVNPFPQPFLIDPIIGVPSAIALPLGYSIAMPSNNLYYIDSGKPFYNHYFQTPQSYLLTIDMFFGIPENTSNCSLILFPSAEVWEDTIRIWEDESATIQTDVDASCFAVCTANQTAERVKCIAWNKSCEPATFSMLRSRTGPDGWPISEKEYEETIASGEVRIFEAENKYPSRGEDEINCVLKMNDLSNCEDDKLNLAMATHTSSSEALTPDEWFSTHNCSDGSNLPHNECEQGSARQYIYETDTLSKTIKCKVWNRSYTQTCIAYLMYKDPLGPEPQYYHVYSESRIKPREIVDILGTLWPPVYWKLVVLPESAVALYGPTGNDIFINATLSYDEYDEYYDLKSFLPDDDYDGIREGEGLRFTKTDTPRLDESPIIDVIIWNRNPDHRASLYLYEGDGVVDFWELYNCAEDEEMCDCQVRIESIEIEPNELRTIRFQHQLRPDHAYYFFAGLPGAPIYPDRTESELFLTIGYKSDPHPPGEDSTSTVDPEPEISEATLGIYLIRQGVWDGPKPFINRFPGYGSIDGDLTGISLSPEAELLYGIYSVRFPKRDRFTDDCDDPDPGAVVVLLPGESLSAEEIEEIYGTPTPRLPATFTACYTGKWEIDRFPIEITYTYR